MQGINAGTINDGYREAATVMVVGGMKEEGKMKVNLKQSESRWTRPFRERDCDFSHACVTLFVAHT